MSDNITIYLDAREFCHCAHLSSELLHEFISVGILEPRGEESENWHFEERMLATARRALRLQRELEIDWAGVALVLELLDQREQLRAENRMLAQRLARFLQD